MKKFISIFLLSAFALFLSAKANRQSVLLSVDIHCRGCCDKIMKNIAFERGVKDLVCDLDTKTVTVTFDPNKTDVPTLLKAFEKSANPPKLLLPPFRGTGGQPFRGTGGPNPNLPNPNPTPPPAPHNWND